MKLMTVRTTVAALLGACSVSVLALADTPKPIDIPAGDLRQALRELSEQLDTELVYRPEQVQGVKTAGARGQLTTEQTIFQLLEGTPFVLRTDSSGAMLIARAAAQTNTPPAISDSPQPLDTGASAEPAASAPEEAKDGSSMEEVIVTGSHLRRIDAQEALPVTVLGKDAMETRDALTPIDMLTSLPLVTNVPANEQPRGGAGARGDVSTVSLRGLSASDSLVLLNGRRLVDHPTTDPLQYAVNVNQLPTQGIARIDVLRDGASSIYGADAVAGVVNYITDMKFRGTKLDVRYGLPQHPGGENIQLALEHGMDFLDGRARLVTTLNVFRRDPIWLRDRDFSASADHSADVPAPFNAPGSSFDGRSGTGIYPIFRLGSGTQANYFRPLGGTMALTTTAPTRANNPEFYGNANAVSMAIDESKRLNSFTSAEFDLTDHVTLFGDFLYYAAQSQQLRNPVALNAPSADSLAPMATDNPYNPYGSRFYDPAGTPNADGTLRLVGTPRQISLQSLVFDPNSLEEVDVHSQTYRLVGGARGNFGRGWNWEVGLLRSYGWVSDKDPNAIRETAFHTALLQTTPGTAYNPFGYTFKVQNGAVVADQPYTNPASVLNTFTQMWRRDGVSGLSSADAHLSGPLLSIWSGDISAAIGTEFRRETYRDYRPPYAGLNPADSGLDPNNNDFVPASPKPDAGGTRKVTSAYVEAVVPLVQRSNDIPLIDSLEVTMSARHEHYSDFGSTTKPKVDLSWRPVRSVMVRASYNEGFTAPSLPLLHNQSQWSFAGAPGSLDPYRTIATGEGPYIYRNGTSGNPDLKPVDSVGKSAGIVFDVPYTHGLSLSADFWQIKQNNIIGTLAAGDVRNNDMLLLEAYTEQQIAAGTPANSIDVGAGTANYKGDPAVVRNAPSAADLAAFAAYNAAHPNAPLAPVGQIFQINLPPQNLSQGIVEGWDFEATYNTNTPIGDIQLDSQWTLTTKSHTTLNVPGGATVYTERLSVDGLAKWRGTTTATWRNGGWTTGVSAYFIGSYADSNSTTTASLYQSLDEPDYIVPQYSGNSEVYRWRVPSVLYFNTFGAYSFSPDRSAWLAGTTVKFGILNLTDKEPPLTGANFGFGYNPGVHAALIAGRTFTLELTKTF